VTLIRNFEDWSVAITTGRQVVWR